MSDQSLEHTRCQVRRARVTVNAALASPRAETLGVVALAPAFLAACDAFDHADSVARGAEIVATKESGDVRAALAPLAERYEVAHAEVTARLGAPLPAAAACATPDQLIAAAEALEQGLAGHEGEAWAAALLGALGPTLDAAIQEQEEDNVARRALRRAELAREQAACALHPVLVAMRRAVRVAYGRGSREYRELLDRLPSPAELDDALGQESPTLPDVGAELLASTPPAEAELGPLSG